MPMALLPCRLPQPCTNSTGKSWACVLPCGSPEGQVEWWAELTLGPCPPGDSAALGWGGTQGGRREGTVP